MQWDHRRFYHDDKRTHIYIYEQHSDTKVISTGGPLIQKSMSESYTHVISCTRVISSVQRLYIDIPKENWYWLPKMDQKRDELPETIDFSSCLFFCSVISFFFFVRNFSLNEILINNISFYDHSLEQTFYILLSNYNDIFYCSTIFIKRYVVYLRY